MPALRPRPFLLACLAVCMSLEAAALGLGSDTGAGALLGQPLNFAVALRLAPGETLEPGCVSAGVRLGDRELAGGLVRTALEFSGPDAARVRVLTLVNVDEPVVTVSLSAGCGARVTRNFVLFADPPELPYAAVVAAATNAAPVAGAAPVAPDTGRTALAPAAGASLGLGASATGQAAGRSPADQAAAAAGALTAPVVAAAPDPAAARRAAEARARAQEARAARAERRRAQREAAAARRAEAARAAAATAASVPAPVAAGPRLRLDAPEPPPSAQAQAVEQAIEAVAQAASTARAMAAAASAAEQRIAALERRVEQLQVEARSNAQANAALRAAGGADRWIGPLLVALVVLGAMAAWLAWRLAELQRLRQAGWREAAAHSRADGAEGPKAAKPPAAAQALAEPPSQQMTRPIPFVTSELMPAPPAATGLRGRTAPAWPPPATSGPDTVPGQAGAPAAGGLGAAKAGLDEPPDPATQRTEVLPPTLRPDHANARDVSIEELIDLEQQAEFFVVLGQDESAIDLLVDHMRNTGGGSPLPYLKLLEIYRRRGDSEAYERTRTRFNHRFNAYAPDWDSDLLHGRTLEEYEGVVPRLQQVWPQPLDAMAELEALLFRKSRGELFDLPAYREVLFLYALARDLLDREALGSGAVDLLLPLSSGLAAAAAGAGAVSPGALDLELAPLGDAEPNTAPVDLDLSLAEQRTSIFDTLDDPPTRPRED